MHKKPSKICLSQRVVYAIILLSCISLFGFIYTKLFVANKPIIIQNRAAANEVGKMSAISEAHLSKEIFNKKVLVVIFDPFISGNQKLSDYIKSKNGIWNDQTQLTRGVIDTFREVSNNRINYSVVKTIYSNTFPIKENGVDFNVPGTTEEYLRCVKEVDDKNGERFQKHCQAIIDYSILVKQNLICEMANANEIDEVWMWGYSWMGFYESILVGKNSYRDNSPPLTSANCGRPIPIMGFSNQVGIDYAIHDFGHRMERIMEQTYQGQWDTLTIFTRWDKYTHLYSLSSNYYGSKSPIHHAPNSRYESDYANSVEKSKSSFDDFMDYSHFTTPQFLENDVGRNIDCAEWAKGGECSHLNYLKWWFSNLPQFSGVGFDGVLNDWMTYLVNPELAVTKRADLSYLDKKKSDCEKLGKKYFEQCGICDEASKKVGEVCPRYCKNMQHDEDACTQSDSRGEGCAWYVSCHSCSKRGDDFLTGCPCYCRQLDAVQCVKEPAKKNGCILKNNICQRKDDTSPADTICSSSYSDDCAAYNSSSIQCDTDPKAKELKCAWYGCSNKCLKWGTAMALGCSYPNPDPITPTLVVTLKPTPYPTAKPNVCRMRSLSKGDSCPDGYCQGKFSCYANGCYAWLGVQENCRRCALNGRWETWEATPDANCRAPQVYR